MIKKKLPMMGSNLCAYIAICGSIKLIKLSVLCVDAAGDWGRVAPPPLFVWEEKVLRSILI